VTGTIWTKKSTFVSRGIAIEYEMKQRFLKSGKWGPYFAFLYRRDSLERVGGFDEELFQSEDKDLFERVRSAGYKIGLVDGFNWFHLYPQDARSLISRSYRAGKQRVVFLFKKKMYGELFKRTAGLWAIAIMLLASVLVPNAALVSVIILLAGYCYRAIRAVMQGRGKGKLTDMILLPTVSALRYLSSAVGYAKGSAVYMTRKTRGLKTAWSDL
jgi:GT2 family glycosyltransferase